MKEKRKEQIRKRKNFLPTLIVTLLLWILVAGLIYFVDPETTFALPGFFLLIFLGLLFAFSTVFASSRQGFLISFGFTLFLILRYFGVGNILNFLLLSGLLITVEIYFVRRK